MSDQVLTSVEVILLPEEKKGKEDLKPEEEKEEEKEIENNELKPEELNEDKGNDDELKPPVLEHAKRGNPLPSIDTTSSVIGVISGEYPCVYKFVQGTLCAGTVALSFDGRLFFFKNTFILMWSDIKSVQKTDIGVIRIVDQQDVAYDFTGIIQADRVWATLKSLHSESIQDRPLLTPLQTAVRASYRRMSTEPLMKREQESFAPAEAAYMAAATVAQMDDVRVLSERRLAPEVDILEKDVDIFTDLEAAWMELNDQKSKQKSYSEVAIKGGELPCDLDTFFKKFYSDDAPHSVQRFMEGNGDKDMSTSTWTKVGENLFKRTIEYSHPINAPLAPPEARARKEQRYRRFGEFGISLETDTFVDDVPMADCFFVTDRILVEPSTTYGVRIVMEFDIRFVKSTMFRSIITNTTKREFLKGFQQQYAMMEAALLLLEQGTDKRSSLRQSMAKSISARLSLISVPQRRASVKWGEPEFQTEGGGGGTPLLTKILMLAVLFMQGYVIIELRGMKKIISTSQGAYFSCVPTVERVHADLLKSAEEL